MDKALQSVAVKSRKLASLDHKIKIIREKTEACGSSSERDERRNYLHLRLQQHAHYDLMQKSTRAKRWDEPQQHQQFYFCAGDVLF